MDILKTVLLYLSMLYISSVQVAPDPSTVNVTPTPPPVTYGIYATTEQSTPAPSPVPTPAITANPAYGQLVMGDRNATVGDVQQRLQELGYYTGKIDSAYGNQTRKAVEQFQYQNGLTVDGIAGKYTQTILFESGDVVAAPVITNTPAFFPDATATPRLETSAPQITSTPSPTPDITAEAAQTPDLNAPVILDMYHFVIDGFTGPLTVQDTDILLHPVQLDDTIYVPLPEILKSMGNVIIESSNGSLEEIAFTVITDFYQISYTAGEDGSVGNLIFEKNAQPQPLAQRSAVILDGIVYLPLEDMESRTGITFTLNEADGVITVTMPSAGT